MCLRPSGFLLGNVGAQLEDFLASEGGSRHRGFTIVASACADCPGFLVPGVDGAVASSSISEPQIVPVNWDFASWAPGHLIGCAALPSLNKEV